MFGHILLCIYPNTAPELITGDVEFSGVGEGYTYSWHTLCIYYFKLLQMAQMKIASRVQSMNQSTVQRFCTILNNSLLSTITVLYR